MRHRQPELHFEASADPGLGDAKLDPAMLRVVEMDYEGDDDRSAARIPAPARTAPAGTAALSRGKPERCRPRGSPLDGLAGEGANLPRPSLSLLSPATVPWPMPGQRRSWSWGPTRAFQ